ncbi:MAG: hypothetical protein M1608_12065, partial [Candidatus Omnitrophica bacterium]|nr:hypothetical protein [Candidatus Omnitrophota bacterium]
YGWMSPAELDFTAYNKCSAPFDTYMWIGDFPPDPFTPESSAPHLSFNPTNELRVGNVRLQPQRIVVHPGPDGERSVLRWTAPKSGPIQITAVFEGRDSEGTTTDASIYQNGRLLYVGDVEGYGEASRVSFGTNVTVNAGDTIDFVVGYGSNHTYYRDSTQVDATIIDLKGAAPNPQSLNRSSPLNCFTGVTRMKIALLKSTVCKAALELACCGGWMATIVAAGGVASATAFAQPEQWLQYHLTQESGTNRRLTLANQAPSGVALPKLGAQPYFAKWLTPMDPKGGRWLCLDRTRRNGPWDRLFIDANGNGQLSDESPVRASRVDEYSGYFEGVRVVFQGEDGPITYHLNLRFYRYQPNSAFLMASSGGWYGGLVDLGGTKRQIQLIDGNVNGMFNDLASRPSDCDRIRIEGDKAGDRLLGRLLEIDNQLFRVEVARDGAFIKVQKAEGVVLGPVRVPESISEFTAVGENGHFARQPVKGEFALPVGRYRVNRWLINRKDNQGTLWTLAGNDLHILGFFEVVAGKPATLEIGEPVRAVLQANESPDGVSFNLRFQGSFRESIEMLRAGQRPSGPRLLLTSADGVYRSSQSFAYG